MSQPDARREGVPSLAEIFFGRLANLWRARRARRSRKTSRLRFETLENRLLLSADLIGDVHWDPAQSSAEQSSELFVVDGALQGHEGLLNELAGRNPLILDRDRDGIEQITQALVERSGVTAVHIVSHGASGSVTLGSTVLDASNLNTYGAQLQAWADSLTADADILFYGCDVAEGESGSAFVENLGRLTGADVAASTDLTGSADLGGDWELEYATGSIEAGPVAVPLVGDPIVLATVNYVAGTDALTFVADTGETDEIIVTAPAANILVIQVANGDSITLEGDAAGNADFVLADADGGTANLLTINLAGAPVLELNVFLGDEDDSLTFSLANATGIGTVSLDGQAGSDTISLGTTTLNGSLTASAESTNVNGTLSTAASNARPVDVFASTTTLNADIVTAGGAITIRGNVILGSPALVALDTTNGLGSAAGGSAIVIAGTVNDDSSPTGLTLRAGTSGVVSLNVSGSPAAVGNMVPIQGLVVENANIVRLPSVSTGEGGVTVTTLGGGPFILLGGNINTAAPGTANAGSVSLTGPVRLGTNVDITTDHVTGTDGNVTFSSTVNEDPINPGPRTLTIFAGGGDVVFGGAVGTLQGLNIASANDVTLQAVNTREGGLTVTTAVAGDANSITLNGAINTTLGGTAGNVLLVGPVTLAANINAGTGAITASGSVTFSGVRTVNAATFSADSLVIGGGASAALNAATTAGTLSLSGTLTGAGVATFTGSGNSTWTGGTYTGTGQLVVGPGHTLTIGGGAAQKAFGTGTLVNDGTVLWTGGNINVIGSGTVLNRGLFDAQGGGNFGDQAFGVGTITFNNELGATLRKSSPGLTAIGSSGGGTPNGVNFNNAGAVEVLSGELSINHRFPITSILPVGTGTSSGTFSVAAGAALHFGGNNTLTANSVVSGAGAVAVQHGTFSTVGTWSHTGALTVNGGNATFEPVGGLAPSALTIAVPAPTVTGTTATFESPVTTGPLTVSGGTATFNAATTATNLNLSGTGTLTGTGIVTLAGPGSSTWTPGGTYTGTGQLVVTADHTLTLSGSLPKRFGTGTLVNEGTVLWTGGNIDVVGNGTIVNRGLFDLQVNGGNFGDSGTGVGTLTFNNEVGATLRKSGPGGVTFFGSRFGGTPNPVNLNNAGTLEVQTGTLSINHNDDGGPMGGSLANSGTILVQGGAMLQRTGGFTSAGLVAGSGTINVGVGNVFINTGTVAPGVAGGDTTGTLTVTGNYAQGTNGRLDIEVGSTAAGGFDVLAISGAATIASAPTSTLSATLVDGFIQTGGDRFRFMTFASRSGFFGTTLLPEDFFVDQTDPVDLELFVQPSIAINDVSVVEGNSGTVAALFNVSLSRPSNQTITVNYSTANGTAGNPDYQTASGILTFDPGETSQPIAVDVNGDLIVEADETFFVNLSGATNAVIGDAQGVGTINNDDTATLTVEDVSVIEGTGDGTTTLTFTVNSSAAVEGGFDVAFSSSLLTAEAADFALLTASPLHFSGTAGETRTITVNITRDAVVEANETFRIFLGNVSETTAVQDAAITTGDTATGTIENDDTATLTVGDVSVVEGTGPGETTLTFTVTSSAAVEGGFDVDFSSLLGTAEADDFSILTTSPLHFAGAAGETQLIEVVITRDAVVEDHETFIVTLGDVSGTTAVQDAAIATGDSATGTINNDDTATLTVEDVSVTEGTGAGTTTLNFTVTSSAAVEDGFDVDFTSLLGTAEAGDFAILTASPLIFAGLAGETQTIAVSITRDAVVEDHETFTVTLGNVSGTTAAQDAAITTGDSATGTINNDDTATLTVEDVSVVEGTGAGTTTLDFTVSLSAAVEGGFDVDFSTLLGTAEADDFLVTTASPLHFAGLAGETRTIAVNITRDAVVEDHETFTVALGNVVAPSAVQDAAITTGDSATGTINNDDTATLTVEDVSVIEGTGVGTTPLTFTVSLSAAVEGGFDVDFSSLLGTAEADDFTILTASPLHFAGTAGETQLIAVAITRDAVVEDHETFTVALGNVTGTTPVQDGAITTGDFATGTINNDDSAVVSISDEIEQEGDALTFEVTISNAVDVAVTADRATADGTATVADGDYTALPDSNVTLFTAGSTTPFLVTVQTTADTKVELDEQLQLILSNLFAGGRDVQFAGGGVTLAGSGTILNDDAATGGLDLIVEAVEWDPDDLLIPGDHEHVTVVVSNVGDTAVHDQVKVKLYASTDGVFDASDIFLDQGHTGSNIEPGNSKTAQLNFAFPSTLLPGEYFLLAVVDPANEVQESNESNNTAIGESFEFSWMFGNVPGHGHKTLTVRDADGTRINFSLFGPGTGEITIEDGEWDLVVTGTNGSSVLSILTLGGGDRRVELDDIHITGAVGGILAPKMDLTGTLAIDGALGAGMIIGSAADAVIAAPTILGTRFFGLNVQGIAILGDLEDSEILIGADLGADGQLGGSGANADTYSAGDLGDLLITGSMISSCVRVGQDPVDGIFDNGNDVLLDGSIDSIKILGQMSDDSFFVASDLPRYARIEGELVNTATDPRFWDTPPAFDAEGAGGGVEGCIDWTAGAGSNSWASSYSPFGSRAGSGQSNFSDFLMRLF